MPENVSTVYRSVSVRSIDKDFHFLSVNDMYILSFQGRLFSYGDTHRHRLGANYLQLPVNCPYRAKVRNYQRDGPQAYDNQGKT